MGSPPPPPTGDITKLNHIIFLAQENRTLDNYFGAMREYWRQNNFPDQSFDGLPQFNPTSGAAPLQGPTPSNPACDPAQAFPMSNFCGPDTNVPPVQSFHFLTMCEENPSPSWNESHIDWNYLDPTDSQGGPAALNGFVKSAADDARQISPPYHDTDGIRAMGYYDGGDLNYYYYMASQFGTSDRFFAPVMSRTSPNREFLIAGTSGGYVYPPGTNANNMKPVAANPIFKELQDAGITWKIYVNPQGSVCSQNPTPQCLFQLSYVHEFAYGQTILTQFPQNIATIDQYTADVQNGTLPQVAQIEPAPYAGLDEHASDTDSQFASVQNGANYVSGLINTLMNSTSWKDSVFILTYDEPGGFYDHVSPQPAVSPDGIKPVDLLPTDICVGSDTAICDFRSTGYRIPLIVVSPYSKKNYVSHTIADETAILKFIETRFKVASLTARDAAQMDMTEFFDFNNAAWLTPPSPPTQNTGGACYLDHLP